MDKEPPEINVNGKLPSSVKFGRVVEIPKVVATDNIDEELTVNVILYNTYKCVFGTWNFIIKNKIPNTKHYKAR